MKAYFDKDGNPTGYSEDVPTLLQPGVLGTIFTILGFLIWVFIFPIATVYLWKKSSKMEKKAKSRLRQWIVALDFSAILCILAFYPEPLLFIIDLFY